METVETVPSHVLNETLIALTVHSGVDYSDCVSLASSSSTLGITSASHCLYWVFLLFILFILFILVYPALVYNVCTGATLRHLLIPVTGASSAQLSSLIVIICHTRED